MSDLKPLVPEWHGPDHRGWHRLAVRGCGYEIGSFGPSLRRGKYWGECGEQFRSDFASEAEAKAWVEAQLYGDNDE